MHSALKPVNKPMRYKSRPVYQTIPSEVKRRIRFILKERWYRAKLSTCKTMTDAARLLDKRIEYGDVKRLAMHLYYLNYKMGFMKTRAVKKRSHVFPQDGIEEESSLQEGLEWNFPSWGAKGPRSPRSVLKHRGPHRSYCGRYVKTPSSTFIYAGHPMFYS